MFIAERQLDYLSVVTRLSVSCVCSRSARVPPAVSILNAAGLCATQRSSGGGATASMVRPQRRSLFQPMGQPEPVLEEYMNESSDYTQCR